MIELVAASAWMMPGLDAAPCAAAAGLPRRRRAERRGRARRRARGFAAVDRAQHVRQLRRFRVFQIDHMNIAAGGGGRIQHRRQFAHPPQPRRIAGAGEHAVGAVIRGNGKTAGRVRRLRRFGEQAGNGLRDVERGRMLERDHDRIGIGRLVDRIDDFRDALQVVRIVRDHQRVVVRVGGDAVVGGDQRAQYRHQLRRRFVLQLEHLRLNDLAPARLILRSQREASVHFGVDLRNDHDHAALLDRGKTLQPQRRQKHLVDQRPGHGLGRDDIDRALDARIENEVLSGDLAHRLHHAFDVGVDKVERDDVGAARARRGAGNPGRGGVGADQAAPAQASAAMHTNPVRNQRCFIDDPRERHGYAMAE